MSKCIFFPRNISHLLFLSSNRHHLCFKTVSTKSPTMAKHLREESDGVGTDKVIIGPVSRRVVQMMKQMGYSHDVNDDESEALISTPGFSTETFDRDGSPSISSLLRFVTTARIYSSHMPLDKSGRTIFDWATLTSDRLTFVASSEVNTDKSLYDVNVPKSPLDIKFQLGYIGSSSMSTQATVLHPIKRGMLVRNINQLVGIDKTTRRPKPLPDWWKEKHQKKSISSEALRVPVVTRPSKTFSRSVRVDWSDTDSYNHTNYTSYPHFCVNALHAAIESGDITELSKADIKCGIKSMRSRYIGESLENDVLLIHVWMSTEQDRTVYFDIEKSDKSIFQSSFEYHEYDKTIQYCR